VSVETAVVSYIVRNGDEAIVYLIDQGITPEYFTSERTQEVYRWLLDQWSTNQHLPSEERFGRRFANFKVVVEPDPLPVMVKELRDHYAVTVAVELTHKITAEFEKAVKTFDLDVALGLIAELQERVNIVRAVNETALLSEKAPSYLEELLAMDGAEVPGIPTGFDTLDQASGGWMPENFVVIGAGPKRFKTAIMVWMAIAAARAGYRCTVLTFEMSIKELMDRIFCEGAQVDLTHIMRGNVTAREERRLREFVEEQKGWGGDIDIVHDVAAATSVAGLAAQLRTKQQRPDIVFIDGMYQMTDDTREWSNEAMALTAVSRGLKRLAATEHIPIIGTTQALDSRISKKHGTVMDSLGYTRAWAQDANVVIGIDRPNPHLNEVHVKVVGARSMAGVTVQVTVDLSTGTLFEGGEIDAAADSDDYG
jgi:replicative DNA helicase